MAKSIDVVNSEGGAERFSVDFPDRCPLCQRGIEPKFQSGYYTSTGQISGLPSRRIEAVFACPRRSCQGLFVAEYQDQKGTTPLGWNFVRSLPFSMKKMDFDKAILGVSEQFAPIYNQAFQAEQHGLDQICGPGYRKALEFLVKDYAKFKNPTAIEEIERKLLGPCIREYIDHPTVKSIAERATWLGNDETHYLRKWENKDLQDLKKLIELTVHWISIDLLSAEVIKDMPDPKTAGTGA